MAEQDYALQRREIDRCIELSGDLNELLLEPLYQPAVYAVLRNLAGELIRTLNQRLADSHAQIREIVRKEGVIQRLGTQRARLLDICDQQQEDIEEMRNRIKMLTEQVITLQMEAAEAEQGDAATVAQPETEPSYEPSVPSVESCR